MVVLKGGTEQCRRSVQFNGDACEMTLLRPTMRIITVDSVMMCPMSEQDADDDFEPLRLELRLQVPDLDGEPALTRFVRCVHCGQTHVSVPAEWARIRVEEYNRLSKQNGWGQTALYERYLRCSRCGASSATMVPTLQSRWESGLTIQLVVIVDDNESEL